MKTVHAGTSFYRSARARRQRGAAVQARAQDVDGAYRRHARSLDAIHHPRGTPRFRHPIGPIEQVVLDHTRVRGLVFGAYGEWSSDVEWLLEEAARTAARRDWRRMGCSAESVAYSRIVASYRWRMGVVAVREMARHRIRQSAYVGLTRQQLDDIMQERERQRDRLEAAAAAADRSVEIAQSYVVPAFERGA